MLPTEPIYSSLGADPVLGELVESFVEVIPTRIETLGAQATARDWDALGRTAHQLKGALGSYGFDGVGPVAKRLETAARQGQPEAQILAALDELVATCRRLQPGTPAAVTP
jgi:HPt (histidine-containing phosphotransfer) domain-containing protein